MADEHREDGTGIGSRREARESALGILYASDRRGEDAAAVLEAQPIPAPAFAADLVHGVVAHAAELDALIDDASEGWSAVLAEVVKLAGDYSTERSGRFVNGVVSRLAEELRPTVDGA